VQATLEQWIAAEESPERFKIIRLKRTVSAVEEEGPRAAELDGAIVAEERVLPPCTPMVLPYRAKRKQSRVSTRAPRH
jgi:hypothetical protein